MFPELETPHAIVDMKVVERNVALVHGYAKTNGLRVRPHTKTHKDPIVGKLQIASGASGLTVATSREAEVMSLATRDLLVAYPPVDPKRLARVLSLPKEVELTIALDSDVAIERLTLASAKHKRFVRVLIELDLGGKRTGVSEVSELLRLARLADTTNTAFSGILFHPGNVRLPSLDVALTRETSASEDSSEDADERTIQSPAFLGADKRTSPSDRALELAKAQAKIRLELQLYLDALKAAGFEASVVSGGNTPTLFASHLIPELTEIRPGTYVYSDRDIASQGILPFESCAYTILATVVSTSIPGQAVIDAGTKAIAREPLPGLDGYGVLLDKPDVVVSRLSEEHGILDLTKSSYRPKVGDRVRVVPNHVCVSVHLQDRIAFVENSKVHLREVAARGR